MIINELSPALSAKSVHSQDMTCPVDILDFLLIHVIPRLRIVMHLQESEVLLQCRSLLWTSLGVQNHPLEEGFILGRVRVLKGPHGLPEACFETKAVA